MPKPTGVFYECVRTEVTFVCMKGRGLTRASYTMTIDQIGTFIIKIRNERGKYPNVDEWQKSLDWYLYALRQWAKEYPQEAKARRAIQEKNNLTAPPL